MPVTINGTTGIAGPDGSASTPAVQGTDSNTGLFYPAADTVALSTGGSERLRIDSAGLVGIGTTTPNTFSFNNLVVASGSANAGMAIYGTGQTTLAFATGTSGGNSFRGYIQYTGGGTDTMAFGTAANERMRIDSSGNVLVGTTTSPSGSGNISINNGIYSVGVYNNSSGQAANLGIDATNKNFYRSTSSIKYKREVQDAVHGLSELLRLRPVTYKGKSPTDGERVFGGLIAEEVHDAGLTEFVQYSITNEPDALAYGNMVSLCVKAIQELKAIVDAQAARISALEAA